jgi:hypothetical protein
MCMCVFVCVCVKLLAVKNLRDAGNKKSNVFKVNDVLARDIKVSIGRFIVR